jgi:hypothetical protein
MVPTYTVRSDDGLETTEKSRLTDYIVVLCATRLSRNTY